MSAREDKEYVLSVYPEACIRKSGMNYWRVQTPKFGLCDWQPSAAGLWTAAAQCIRQRSPRRSFSFEAQAKDITMQRPNVSQHAGLEVVGAWTDGVALSSEYDQGWPCAFRLIKGKHYRITVEEID